MTLRAQVAFSFLFATLCLAASPVQAQSVLRKSRTITSQDDENSPPLTIRVYKFAPLSSWTLVSAETEAARILRRTHLRLAWINCPSAANSGSCSIPEGPTDLILRVLATALPQASADALGMAAAAPYGNCAFLFYDRIVACRTYRALTYQVLGRAIAHEMVHLLLPASSHTVSGLMRKNWSTEDLQFGGQAGVGLSTRWIKLIQEEGLRRTRAAKTVLDK